MCYKIRCDGKSWKLFRFWCELNKAQHRKWLALLDDDLWTHGLASRYHRNYKIPLPENCTISSQHMAEETSHRDRQNRRRQTQCARWQLSRNTQDRNSHIQGARSTGRVLAYTTLHYTTLSCCWQRQPVTTPQRWRRLSSPAQACWRRPACPPAARSWGRRTSGSHGCPTTSWTPVAGNWGEDQLMCVCKTQFLKISKTLVFYGSCCCVLYSLSSLDTLAVAHHSVPILKPPDHFILEQLSARHSRH